MSALLRAGGATLLLLLSPCIAWHNANTHHGELLTDRYAAVLHDMGSTSGGAVLADAKLTDLTSSIQGVFPVSTAANPTTQQSSGFLMKNSPKQVGVNVSQIDADYQVWIGHGNTPAVTSSDGGKPVTISSVNQTEMANVSAVVSDAAEAVQTQNNTIADTVNHSTGTDSSVAQEQTNNASAVANQTDANNATENKTKVIEEAVVSLPMASFALDDEKPAVQNVTNVTKKEFPGNATEKAAWEKKEHILEKEVEILKAQLKNVSDTIKPTNASETIKPKTASAPKQDVQVDLHPPSKVVVVAQAPRNDQAQDSKDKKLTMSSAFTAPPSKKIASALQSEANVERRALVGEDESSTQESSPIAIGGFFSRLFSWFTAPMRGPVPMLPSRKQSWPPPPPLPHRSGLLWIKQDSARTARMAHEESQHNIEVKDAWSQLEQKDQADEESVRREDVAERERAERPAPPHTPLKSELQGRHGAQMSGFWSKLEDEDYNIEQQVRSDDLDQAAKLTDVQDSEVSHASAELGRQAHVEHATLRQNSDGRLSIHEPWKARQESDEVIERKIHDSPDLQMLQLRHQRRHK